MLFLGFSSERCPVKHSVGTTDIEQCQLAVKYDVEDGDYRDVQNSWVNRELEFKKADLVTGKLVNISSISHRQKPLNQ